MKVYNSIPEYSKEAKLNDILIFGGTGILDGITSSNSKHDTYKVCSIGDNGTFHFKAFRGRNWKRIGSGYEQQKVALLTKKEFQQLPTLY